MKEHYAHLALLGTGALAVLWYLTRSAISTPSAPAASGATVISSAGPVQQYPSIPPAAPINIGGSPTNLTYNTFEAGAIAPQKTTVEVTPAPASAVAGSSGACGCDDHCAKPLGTKVSVMHIPALGLKAAIDNVQSFQGKETFGIPALAPEEVFNI